MAPRSDGPDLSHWNEVGSWDAMKPYRLFVAKATEGRGFRSPTFDENWEQMRRKGFEFRGAYHWIRSDSPMSVQLDNLKRAIDDHGGLQPGEFIMIDWETTPGIPAVSLLQIRTFQMLCEVEWPGRVSVYCSDWVPHFSEWRTSFLGASTVLFYANYNLTDSSRGGRAEVSKWSADVWQWTSSATEPGFIDPTIDMNQVENWDALKRITQTEEDDDMAPQYLWKYGPEPGMFWVKDGSVVHIDAVVRDSLISQGVQQVVSDNRTVYESYKSVAMGK